MLRLLLLNMPFVSLARPALGISLLKSRIQDEGEDCAVGYVNLFMADKIGVPAYEMLDTRLSPALFVGDWLFAQYLFPEIDQAPYIATLRRETTEPDFDAVMNLRDGIGPFLEECLEAFDIDAYDVIGFTTTFQQNLASLSMARLVKSRCPNKITVLGGANCEGVMGFELHRRFPWIDYICTGESDYSSSKSSPRAVHSRACRE